MDCQCCQPHTSNIKFHFTVSEKVFSALLKQKEKEEKEEKKKKQSRADSLKDAFQQGLGQVARCLHAGRLVQAKARRNFIVVKLPVTIPPIQPWHSSPRESCSCVYTIFPERGYVNVSGVRNFYQIQFALDVFNEAFKTCVQRTEVAVDNSTSSGQLLCNAEHPTGRLNLPRLKHFIESESAHAQSLVRSAPRLHLRPFYFPGAILRFTDTSFTFKEKEKEKEEQNPLKRRGRARRRRRRRTDGRGSAILFSNGKYVIVGAKSPDDIQLVHRRVCALTSTSATTSTPATGSVPSAARSWAPSSPRRLPLPARE